MCHIKTIYGNKVLAINKNGLGCSVYFCSFPLVQYLQVCFKRGTRQETRVTLHYQSVVPQGLSAASRAECC